MTPKPKRRDFPNAAAWKAALFAWATRHRVNVGQNPDPDRFGPRSDASCSSATSTTSPTTNRRSFPDSSSTYSSSGAYSAAGFYSAANTHPATISHSPADSHPTAISYSPADSHSTSRRSISNRDPLLTSFHPSGSTPYTLPSLRPLCPGHPEPTAPGVPLPKNDSRRQTRTRSSGIRAPIVPRGPREDSRQGPPTFPLHSRRYSPCYKMAHLSADADCLRELFGTMVASSSESSEYNLNGALENNCDLQKAHEENLSDSGGYFKNLNPHYKKDLLNCLQLTCRNSNEAFGVTPTFLKDLFNKALMHSHSWLEHAACQLNAADQVFFCSAAGQWEQKYHYNQSPQFDGIPSHIAVDCRSWAAEEYSVVAVLCKHRALGAEVILGLLSVSSWYVFVEDIPLQHSPKGSPGVERKTVILLGCVLSTLWFHCGKLLDW
ncbi:hypothetical protein VP01_1827g3 [Puccinia sorghi]|uniref:Uncharacterized protein n=1 Tax=Puccinia sorghi TaxID=27349 RepID=A0A0L6VDY1_9BASI|nr:hypothetical protein VP01_1827g3 [Puccinia sorghi]